MKNLKENLKNATLVKVSPTSPIQETITDEQIELYRGTPENPNTVSSYIDDEDGIIIDELITKGVYNITNPSHIDNLSNCFINITDHKAYMESLMETISNPNTTNDELINAIEYKNNTVPFGPGNEGLVIPKNIYPDMYYAVNNDSINYYKTSDDSIRTKVFNINSNIRNVLNTRFVSLYDKCVAKAVRKTIEFFFDSFVKYATKFIVNNPNSKMSQQDIINMGRSIELFGNSYKDSYTGNIFSCYPSISYSVVDNIYKFITSDNKKAYDIDINDFQYLVNNDVMNLYTISETSIHNNLLKWFSENGFNLTALRHANLLNPADIESMALDALAKSLFYYKSDLLQAINTLIVESVAYVELPDGFKEKYKEEVEKRKSRCRNHDDYCDDF